MVTSLGATALAIPYLPLVEAGQFSEGTGVEYPVDGGEVTLTIAEAVDRNHAVGEMVSVTDLMETDEELVRIGVSYSQARDIPNRISLSY